MFSYTLCKAIAADMFDAFVTGGEDAARNVFDAAMDYWDTYGDSRDMFEHHVMVKYRAAHATSDYDNDVDPWAYDAAQWAAEAA